MSMYRQLWLAISLSTLLALAGSLFASIMSSRAYLNEQLRMKNNDNATVLALSLSQKNIDATELELIIASLFDNGHYQSIKVTDPKGQLLVERASPEEHTSVPDWFTKLLPISSQPGIAQISSGWKQIGSISIVSQTGTAYQTLWNSTREMILALALSGFLASYLGTLVIRRLKKPLRDLIDQARAMVERRFITVEESQVPELRQLSVAMNSTTTLLKAMFAEEAERLDQLRRQANTDTVCGLYNRANFLSQLQITVEEENAPPGSLVMIRLNGLIEANRTLGRVKTDTLLRNLGQILNVYQNDLPDGFAARLNGTDFALLSRNSAIEEIVASLLEQITSLFSTSDANLKAFIGYGNFEYGISPSILLSQVDAAVASAEASDVSSVHKAAPLNIEHAPKSLEEWSKLIQRALDQNWVKLDYFPVINHQKKLIHQESALRLMFGGEWFPAGRFLPIAERLGLSAKLDVISVKLALDAIESQSNEQQISVNISAKSIQDTEFREQVKALLSIKPQASKSLWLEVPEIGAFSNLDTFRNFQKTIESYGCKLGLEHFGKNLEQINLLNTLDIDFVKFDVSFVRNIEAIPANFDFLKGAVAILHRMNLQVYVEGLARKEEFDALANLDLEGMTGPFIGKLLNH